MTAADTESQLGEWVEAKLTRAVGHLTDLKARVKSWSDSQPYDTETVIADDRLRWQFYLRVTEQPPLSEWSIILGDCVHNLRSALDAAV